MTISRQPPDPPDAPRHEEFLGGTALGGTVFNGIFPVLAVFPRFWVKKNGPAF